jgi:hypothetical protein
MTKATTIGLDIAKQAFQVHATDGSGRAVLRRKLRRNEVIRFFSEQPPCLVGIEARSSAPDWARVLSGLGHTVRLMAPQFVKPYVKSQKNDANDAEAICEAVWSSTPNTSPSSQQSRKEMPSLPHDSWNREPRAGYEVVVALMKDGHVTGGTTTSSSAFSPKTGMSGGAPSTLRQNPPSCSTGAL